jgi:mRNA-degrading endonuclease RelE of RelBE toxin-antitoxin system
MFELLFTNEANTILDSLENDKSQAKRLKAVQKSLAYLESNPRHPSLNTHKYSSFVGPNGEEIFEAYAENKTSAAYRIFWYYDPNKGQITILTITPHP